MEVKDVKNTIIADLWLNNNTVRDVTELTDGYGPLFPGTENERHGKDWLVAKFKEYGLENVRAEEFRYMGWKRGDVCTLELIGIRSFCGRPMKVCALPRSPPTPEDGVIGEVLYLGSGTREDFERNENRIPGKIVMVRSGGPSGRAIYRVEKYNLARKMGAEGFIFMFGMEGDLVPTGTIKSEGEGVFQEAAFVEKPPAVGIPLETGEYIIRMMKKGPVRVRIKTNDEYMPDTPGWNVVGDVPGYKYPDEVILIGGHWDGHDIGQGALDDALGAVGLLNIGRALAKHKGSFKRTLRVVSFGVEETGRYGSRSYVKKHEEDLGNIVCMFNGDGFGRRGDAVIRSNNDDVLKYLRKTIKEEDIPIRISEEFKGRTGSDAAPFYVEGVPTASIGGTTSDGGNSSMRAKGRYPDHTVADTVDKMDVKKIRTASMKFAQILIAMLNEDKRFTSSVPKQEVMRDIEETMNSVEMCRGKCIGYRPPFG